MLTTFHKVGDKRGVPRLWVESTRLHQLGFDPKTFLQISTRGNRLELTPTLTKTKHKVSYRTLSGQDCPIIDLNNGEILAALTDHTELKLQASYKLLSVTPSIRSFSIQEHRTAGLPIPTIEYFAGGSTLSQAITSDPRFSLKGAVEISPKFASHFALEHPDVPIYQCDIRDLSPADLPRTGFMFASLPCTCFSSLGVAKKKLKGNNEIGDTGDLFLSFVQHVAAHMPLAVMVENVPAFFGDKAIAGRLMATHLERIGYHVSIIELYPTDEWNEPQDRRRTVMVATLYGKFYPSIPMQPFTGTAGQFLDAPDATRDAADAKAIQNSIAGRKRHQARHAAAGNHFGFSVINHASVKIPTITKSYWKINAGPFVETQFGLRLLRQSEIERIMGFTPSKGYTSKSYSTAVEILGQGVQTRIFKQLITQLGDFLEYMILQKKPTNFPQFQQVK